MTSAPIKMIKIDNHGHLRVYPEIALSGTFKFIYRAAAGITWDEEEGSLVAREPDRWEPAILFGQILSVVKSEYGTVLQIIPETIWSNVPENLKILLVTSDQHTSN